MANGQVRPVKGGNLARVANSEIMERGMKHGRTGG